MMKCIINPRNHPYTGNGHIGFIVDNRITGVIDGGIGDGRGWSWVSFTLPNGTIITKDIWNRYLIPKDCIMEECG